MSVSSSSSQMQLDASAFVAGTVHSVGSDGETMVVFRENPDRMLCCSVLHAVGSVGEVPPVGCPVLVWVDAVNSRGVILGMLEPPPVKETSPVLPRELLIEAGERLTLRVGDGSITIRADGKILIKGKDLVSHAKNVNRIKGGAVAIN